MAFCASACKFPTSLENEIVRSSIIIPSSGHTFLIGFWNTSNNKILCKRWQRVKLHRLLIHGGCWQSRGVKLIYRGMKINWMEYTRNSASGIEAKKNNERKSSSVQRNESLNFFWAGRYKTIANNKISQGHNKWRMKEEMKEEGEKKKERKNERRRHKTISSVDLSDRDFSFSAPSSSSSCSFLLLLLLLLRVLVKCFQRLCPSPADSSRYCAWGSPRTGPAHDRNDPCQASRISPLGLLAQWQL